MKYGKKHSKSGKTVILGFNILSSAPAFRVAKSTCVAAGKNHHLLSDLGQLHALCWIICLL